MFRHIKMTGMGRIKRAAKKGNIFHVLHRTLYYQRKVAPYRETPLIVHNIIDFGRVIFYKSPIRLESRGHMLFLFGRSLPKSLSRYFSDRAAEDGHRVIFASMGNFPSSEAFSELRGFSPDDMKGQAVVVFQSLADAGDFSANDYFTQMLWAGDTLKRYGAGPLWAVTPLGPIRGRTKSVQARWIP